MAKKARFTVVLVAIMAIGAIFSNSASASTTPESAHAHSEVTSVAFKVVKQKGWTGVQEHIRIQKVPKSQCGWYKTFYNSDYLVGETNQKPQMYIDHNGYLCPDKFSPTGWVKRGGGETESDCGNIAAPLFVKPPFPIVKPPAIELNSSSELKVKVKIKVEAAASLALPCGTATGSGFAYDLIEVNYKTYIKSKHDQNLKLRLAATVIAEAKDHAEATAEVQCPGSPPPSCTVNCHPCTIECTPPPEHWTEVSCTGFEEVFGSAGLTIDCVVSNDNGKPISLYAKSNDSNTRVSGINCYSNGGSQTCPSGGIFEFLVSGESEGSTTLYSSVTVTASSNGVEKTRVYGPFAVDPKNGGF